MRRFIILLFIIFLATEWNCSYGQYQWIIQLKDGSSVTYDIDNIKEMRVLEKIVEPPIIPSDAIITFNASVGNSTDIDAATELGNSFVVEAVKSHGTTDTQSVVLNNYIIKYVGKDYPTMTNTSGWEYVGLQSLYNDSQTIKYWDYGHEQYDFIAYSAGKATAVYNVESKLEEGQVYFSPIDASKLSGVKDEKGKISGGAYTIKGKAEDLAKVYIADMVTVSRGDIATSDYKKDVNIRFRPLSAKIRIGFYETVPGYNVKDLEFYEAEEDNTPNGSVKLYTIDSNIFNEKGTYTVFFPTIGLENNSHPDYNIAHTSFSPEIGGTNKDFGTLQTNSDKNYIGNTVANLSFAGDPLSNYYSNILPSETGAVLTLKANYKLVKEFGGGEICVNGAKVQVPAKYSVWNSGYNYTYLFKIAYDDEHPNQEMGQAGYYPIVFDGVMIENNGSVEFITL